MKRGKVFGFITGGFITSGFSSGFPDTLTQVATMKQAINPAWRSWAHASQPVPRRRQPSALAADPFVPTLSDADHTCRLHATSAAFSIVCRVAQHGPPRSRPLIAEGHSATLAGRGRLVRCRTDRGNILPSRLAHSTSFLDSAPETDEVPNSIDKVQEWVALHMAR